MGDQPIAGSPRCPGSLQVWTAIRLTCRRDASSKAARMAGSDEGTPSTRTATGSRDSLAALGISATLLCPRRMSALSVRCAPGPSLPRATISATADSSISVCSNGASTARVWTNGNDSHPVLTVLLAVVPVATSVSGRRRVAAWCVAHCVAVVEPPAPIPTTTPNRCDGSVRDAIADSWAGRRLG